MGEAYTLRDYIPVGLGLAQGDVDGIVAGLALRHHVGQIEIAVGSAYQIGVVAVYEFVLDALCHTSQYTQDEAAALLLLGMQGLEAVVYLVLGVLAYATGVEENGVGVGLIVTQVVARHLHDGSHHLRVCHVHLASVGLYIQLFHYLEFSIGFLSVFALDHAARNGHEQGEEEGSRGKACQRVDGVVGLDVDRGHAEEHVERQQAYQELAAAHMP